MKKSQMTRKVLKVLKNWEGSRLETKTANEIIDAMVEAGMLPPWSNQADGDCECGCHGRCPKGNEWDCEHMPIGANQTVRYSR